MNEAGFADESLPGVDLHFIDQICLHFEMTWKEGAAPRVEDYLQRAPERIRLALLPRLLELEVDYRRRRGEQPTPTEYHQRFPHAAAQIEEAFAPRTRPSTPNDPELLARLLQLGILEHAQIAALLRLWKESPTLSVPDLLQQFGLSVKQLDQLRQGTRAITPDGLAVHTVVTDKGRGAGPVSIGPALTVIPGQEAALLVRPETRARYAPGVPLGQGGLGKVYQAHDCTIGRGVAIKEMLRHTDNPLAQQRFLIEAQVTGQLDHPGIVPIYEVGQKADGAPFYAMKLLGSRTLEVAIKEYYALAAEDEQRPLRFNELLSAFVGVCNAVAFAHSRGVVHQDLKPGNVMLGDFGEAIVIDWGMAWLLHDEPAAPGQPARVWSDTLQWAAPEIRRRVGGTLAYMAPEQLRVHGARQCDARSEAVLDARVDVYGLGAILYQLLTGKAPIHKRPEPVPAGGLMEWIYTQVTTEQIPAPRTLNATVPRALEAVCRQALAPDPTTRYQSARELALEVQRWQAGEPVAAYPDPLWVKARRWARRHRTLCASVAAGLLVVVLGGGIWGWQESRRRDQVRTAVERTQEEARRALERGDYEQARDPLLQALALLEGESWARAHVPELEAMHAQIEQRRQARARLAAFRRHRDEALLSGTLTLGDDLGTHLNQAAASAHAALAAAEFLPLHGPQLLPGAYSAAEERELAEGCSALQFTLAEIAVLLHPAQPVAGARAALQHLEAIPERARGAAYFARWSRYRVQAGEQAVAPKEIQEESALDWRWRAEECFTTNKLTEAAQAWRIALVMEPARFEALYLLAVCELRRRQWSAATDLFTACAGIRPDFLGIYLLRGVAHAELGEVELSERDFATALTLNPRESSAHLNRGFARLRHGRWADAAADFTQAIGTERTAQAGYFNRAEAARRQGHYDDALADLDAVIAQSEGSVLATLYLQRARTWLENPALDVVTRQTQVAADLRRAQAHALPNSRVLAEILTEQGRLKHDTRCDPHLDEAITRYLEARQAAPDYLEATRLLIDAYLNRQQPDVTRALDEIDLYLKKSNLEAEAWAEESSGGAPPAGASRRTQLAHLYREKALALLQHYGHLQMHEVMTLYFRAEALLVGDKGTSPYERHRQAQLQARIGWSVLNDEYRGGLALTLFDKALKQIRDLPDKRGDAFAGRGYARALLGQAAAAHTDARAALLDGPPDLVASNVACIYCRLARAAEFQHADRLRQAAVAEALKTLDLFLSTLAPRARQRWWDSMKKDSGLDPLMHEATFTELLKKHELDP